MQIRCAVRLRSQRAEDRARFWSILQKMSQRTTYEYEPKTPEKIEPFTERITEEGLDHVVSLIQESKRPYIFVGGGSIISGASEEVRELAHRIQAPVCDTLMGKGAFPGTDELYTGMLGMHGTKTSNYGVTKCDLLIVLGARFSDRVTGNAAKFANNAKIVQIDVDAAEINKNVVVESSIIGDVKEVLKRLNAKLEPMHHDEWIAEIEAMKEKFPLKHEEGLTGPFVIEEIYKATNGEAIITTDVGQHQMWAAQYYRYTSPRTLLTSGGLGTMGFGLPAAIGATFGRPDRTVCVFMGDGGLQMNIQELGTIMEQKAPVKIILLNNNYLGNVRQWQAMFFGHRYSFTPMLNPDYMKIAEAYEIPARRVMKREELQAAIHEMLTTDGPFLLEACVIEEGNVLPMTPPGGSVNQMLLEC